MGNHKNVCIVIHGFTGGPYEVQHLADHLSQEGYTVVVPTLAGHTGNLSDLASVSYLDWIESVESVLKELVNKYEKINIIGFSMGGLIGLYLANKYNINTLTTLSTPIYVGSKKIIVKNIYNCLTLKDFQRMRKYIYNIRNTPLRAILNFKVMLIKAKALLDQISIPALILQGLKDDVVHPKSASYIYDAISSNEKEIHYLADSSHIICCDTEKEQVARLVACFLSRY